MKSDLFRSATFAEDIIGAEKVMLVVYDIQGNVAEALTFKGTTNENSWFSKENLISTNKWNLNGGFNFFSLQGDPDIGRRVYINEAYNGCEGGMEITSYKEKKYQHFNFNKNRA